MKSILVSHVSKINGVYENESFVGSKIKIAYTTDEVIKKVESIHRYDSIKDVIRNTIFNKKMEMNRKYNYIDVDYIIDEVELSEDGLKMLVKVTKCEYDNE